MSNVSLSEHCCWNAFRDRCKGADDRCPCHAQEAILKQIPRAAICGWRQHDGIEDALAEARARLAVAEQERETAEQAYREARHERDNERALRLLALAERDAARAAGEALASVLREYTGVISVSAWRMGDPDDPRVKTALDGWAALSAASTAGGAAPAPEGRE